MIISTNGSHKLPRPFNGIGGAVSIVYVSGVFGTATAKFTYFNEEGTEVDLSGGTIPAGDEYVLEHGSIPNNTLDFYINVSGVGGGTNLVVTVASKS